MAKVSAQVDANIVTLMERKAVQNQTSPLTGWRKDPMHCGLMREMSRNGLSLTGSADEEDIADIFGQPDIPFAYIPGGEES